MYKVGICGHFGFNKDLLNGQTIKTKMINEELCRVIGFHSVSTVDSCDWKKNPLSLLVRCYNLIKDCENVVILPAHNGVKVFIPLFLILNKIFHRKLHYIVIGGWLPELLVNNQKLKKNISKLDGVYVETNNMIKSLREIGVKNVRKLTNFKHLDPLKENDLIYPKGEPYKLCTFSRVMREKGIEDAIEVVKKVNNFFKREVYTLDIYGQVDENYKNRFEEVKKSLPEYISYKGSVNFNESKEILKNYFVLLFPTHFKTEGVPGTIIDAYAAGIPVFASRWNSASEIIKHNITGLIYDFNDNSKLEKILFDVVDDVDFIIKMKKACLEQAKQYSPEVVIEEFNKYL